MTDVGSWIPLERYKEKERSADTHPLMQAYNGLGYVVYKRTYARNVEGEDRTEEWWETVLRVVEGAAEIGAGLTAEEEARLYDHIWHGRAFPGGRMLWQLGTPNIKRYGGDSLVNCWYTRLGSVADFTWMFERLMLGGGVGFSVDHGHQLGCVQGGAAVHEAGYDVDFVVPDNRHGWAQLLYRTMNAHLRGTTFTYSTDALRPAGAPIKTFGGKASGPGPLRDGVDQIQDVLRGAEGRMLNSVEVLDIANIIGSIVVSGNVRRSAQIAMGGAHDEQYMQAKRWDLGQLPNWRAMSHNSVVANSQEELNALAESFWDGYRGLGEPYGLLHVENAKRYGRMGDFQRDDSIEGFNPCAEIPLADRESCNLAELVLPKFESYDQMLDAAILLYKVQKAIAALPYLDPRSDQVTSQNMRLGLGVTGVMQATQYQCNWLHQVYGMLKYTDKVWSAERGLPESVRLTTVKPSGTLSLLAGVTAGGHPAFSRFYIRRVRMAANDPVLRWCTDQGYPWEWVRGFDGIEDTRTAVVEFPVYVPGATLAENMSAVDQLEVVRWLQEDWADNSVSVTIYYRDEELPAIREYLGHNWDRFKSLSFLRHEEHGFDQAPMERISADEYNQRFSQISHAMGHVHGHALEILDSDCATGACPVR